MKTPLHYRLVACFLILVEAVIGWPLVTMSALAREADRGEESSRDVSNVDPIGPVVGAPVIGQAEGVVNTKPVIPKNATDGDIMRARIFLEPLVPLDWEPVEGENKALAKALNKFIAQGDREDVAVLDGFLKEYPASRWRAAIQTNVAILRRKAGYFEEALGRLEDAWAISKSSVNGMGSEIANRAVGELADLNARFGRFQRMAEIFAETDARDIAGSAQTQLQGAKEGYWRMTKKVAEGFRCGPFAVNAVLNAGGKYVPNPEVAKLGSSQLGTNLGQLEELAGRVGMDYVPAKRSPGAAWPVPLVAHWKVGHFGAITRKVEGRYLVEDPTFGGEIWVTDEALDKEASGYGLVPSKDGRLPDGWQAVAKNEAAEVWGRGGAPEREDGPCPKKAKEGCGNRMAEFNMALMAGTLELTDYPVGYTPPVGPQVEMMVRFKYLESGQPQNLNYSNFGPFWVSNWISFIEVAAGGTITLRARGGGTDVISSAQYDPVRGTYPRSFYSGGQFVRASPVRYEFRRRDGGVDVYSQVDGVTPRIFLKEVIDAQGNKVTLNYDSAMRITSIVDALGQSTTFSYKSNTLQHSLGVWDELGFYKIASVTDPFGRGAAFFYDSALRRLEKIRDVNGIESSFVYADNGFVKRLTTPYGNTDFYKYTPAEESSARGLLAVLPDGSEEALESYIDHTKASYYWDRKAMALGRGDRAKATVYRWLMRSQGFQMVDAVQSMKRPFEDAVTFEYPDQPPATQSPDPNDPPQTLHYYNGSLREPSVIRRPLEGGGEQVYRYDYNELGRVKKFIDPVGRTFEFSYAANNLDLMEVRQTRSGNNDLLFKATYNNQHRPLTQTDASGRKTTFTYNGRGQTTSVTNAKNETTTLTYDGNGYLTRIDGPLSGTNDRTDLAYDSAGRISSLTRVEGPNGTDQWTASFLYDNLDRLTKTTFPDGSTEENVYNRLDLVRSKDRLGRWTTYTCDALGQRVAMRDPSGALTQYEWCRCGALQGLTDPAGNVTKWSYDAQGRLIEKRYADQSNESYEYETKTSRLKRVTDPQGTATNYTYFADNRLATVTWDPANGVDDVPDVTLVWDANYPRIQSVGDSTATYTYNYKAYVTDFFGSADNGRGQVSSITNSGLANATIGFAYDNLGRAIKRTVNGTANETTWDFDAAGRLSTLTNPLGTFTPAYQNAAYGVDRLASLTMPNGAVTNYQWEANTGDFRLKEIQNLGAGSAAVSKFNYVTDAVSRITQWKQQKGTAAAERFDVGYNAVDELTSAVLKTDATNATLKAFYYGYDKAANRTSQQEDNSVKTYAFNNLNQLTGTSAGGATRFQGTLNEPGTVTVGGQNAWMQGATNFLADVNLTTGTNNVAVVAKDANNNSRTNTFQVVIPSGGSTTVTSDAAGNMLGDGTNAYRWDAANRLVRTTYPGGAKTEYTYDALGRRVKIVEKNSGGTVTSTKQFVFDGMDEVEQRDGSNTVTKRYYDQGFRDVAANASYFYTKDHLGSIRELLDASGALVSRYDYDPYGKTTKVSGTVDSDMLYTGHYYDQASGLDLTMYRAYKPELARWLSRDPIGEEGGINLYGYVGNNPVNFWDEHGRNPVSALWRHIVGDGSATSMTPDVVESLQNLQKAGALPRNDACPENPENLDFFQYASIWHPIDSLNVGLTLGQLRYTNNGRVTTVSDRYAFPFMNGPGDYHNAQWSWMPGKPYDHSATFPSSSRDKCSGN